MSVNTKDLVIHTQQPKGKMVKVLFEPNAKLTDSLTYDITAWSLPYAHGFKAIASTIKVSSRKDVMRERRWLERCERRHGRWRVL